MSTTRATEHLALINYSIAGLNIWLEREFKRYSNKDLVVKTITSPNGLRQISAMLSAPDRYKDDPQYISLSKLSYPYLLSAIGDISLDETRHGLNKRAYRNIVAAKDINAGHAITYNLRPVRIGLGIVFNTDNQNDLLAFSEALLMNAPAATFLFEGENNFNIGIKIEIEPSITAPPVNYETPGEAYQFNTVITLQTWIGNKQNYPLIKEVRLSVIEQNKPKDVFYDGPAQDLLRETIDLREALRE